MIFKITSKTLFFVLILMLQNCSFYSFKGSVPSHIDSVVISPFKNETSEYIISDLLNDKFLRLMLLENILDIVSFEEADSKLDITIKSISDKPNVYSFDTGTNYEIIDEWKIQMNVKIQWYDLINNENIIEKNITEWATYSLGNDIGNDNIDNDLDGLIDNQDDDEYGIPREGALRITMEKLSKRIINELTSTW